MVGSLVNLGRVIMEEGGKGEERDTHPVHAAENRGRGISSVCVCVCVFIDQS